VHGTLERRGQAEQDCAPRRNLRRVESVGDFDDVLMVQQILDVEIEAQRTVAVLSSILSE
jgi:hypothetical protein